MAIDRSVKRNKKHNNDKLFSIMVLFVLSLILVFSLLSYGASKKLVLMYASVEAGDYIGASALVLPTQQWTEMKKREYLNEAKQFHEKQGIEYNYHLHFYYKYVLFASIAILVVLGSLLVWLISVGIESKHKFRFGFHKQL